jgi:hypothetical protein
VFVVVPDHILADCAVVAVEQTEIAQVIVVPEGHSLDARSFEIVCEVPEVHGSTLVEQAQLVKLVQPVEPVLVTLRDLVHLPSRACRRC